MGKQEIPWIGKLSVQGMSNWWAAFQLQGKMTRPIPKKKKKRKVGYLVSAGCVGEQICILGDLGEIWRQSRLICVRVVFWHKVQTCVLYQMRVLMSKLQEEKFLYLVLQQKSFESEIANSMGSYGYCGEWGKKTTFGLDEFLEIFPI